METVFSFWLNLIFMHETVICLTQDLSVLNNWLYLLVLSTGSK